MEQYRYADLPHVGSYIRLLRIIRIDSTKLIPFECELQPYDLSASPEYAAISYTWGSATHAKQLLIEGSVFDIGANAYYALNQVAGLDTPPGCIWMDSICIHQTDNTEKSLQVAMMADIYQNAEIVYAFVGPEAIDSDVFLGILDDLYPHIEDETNTAPEDHVALLHRVVRGRFRNKMKVANKNADYYEMFIQACIVFCNRKYWCRRWVVQEQLFAKSASILCGQVVLRLDGTLILQMVQDWLPNDTDAWARSQ